MATPITTVSGIGAQTAEILIENGFVSAEVLAAAKEEDLLKISGFGPSRAKKFIEAAQALVGAVEASPVPEAPVLAELREQEVVVEEANIVVEKKEKTTEKPSGPKVCTQKLSKKKKKKDKPAKNKKKKKKSSRKKK